MKVVIANPLHVIWLSLSFFFSLLLLFFSLRLLSLIYIYIDNTHTLSLSSCGYCPPISPAPLHWFFSLPFHELVQQLFFAGDALLDPSFSQLLRHSPPIYAQLKTQGGPSRRWTTSCVKLIRVLSFTVVALRTYHLSLDHCATTSLLSNPSWWFSSLSLALFFSLSLSLHLSIYLYFSFLFTIPLSPLHFGRHVSFATHVLPSLCVCISIKSRFYLSLSLQRGRLTFIWDPSGFFLLLYY